MKRMIGLMGNSGAGKSTVASFLMELGADVIDADKISHDICDPGNAGYDAVRKGFGEQFFGTDGKLDRRKLGAYVFANPQELKRLEQILHPLVLEEMDKRVAASASGTIVVDCALLIDAGLESWVDEIWLVTAAHENKKERIKMRDGIDEEHAKNRLGSQRKQDELLGYADVVIHNDASLSELKKQVGESFYGTNNEPQE